MRYARIYSQRKAFPLPTLVEDLAVSISGHKTWKRGHEPNYKRLTDAHLITSIQTIHRELKAAYGSPRMLREVRDHGFPSQPASSASSA